MVEFLTTTSISAELEKLIKSAREEITLISPYLKVNQRLQGFIRDADLRRVRLTVIYGKRDMQDAEREWIRGLTTPAETWFVPNLHAKCYLSEDAAIITSMNLYEFSQQNNDEMGIYVSRINEPALYQDIKEEALRLRRIGAPTETSPPTASDQPPAAVPDQQGNPLGYCIRCRTPVTLDPGKPYCDQHYRIWARYGDKTYEENSATDAGKSTLPAWQSPCAFRASDVDNMDAAIG